MHQISGFHIRDQFGFLDVFNLADTGVLKEVQLNSKGAVAAKGKTLSTYPSSLGLGTTETSDSSIYSECF